MATVTATVIPEGLALPASLMAELNLKPGAEITVIIAEEPRRLPPADLERLIKETRGMLAHLGGGMAEELIEQRREEERRFQAKT